MASTPIGKNVDPPPHKHAVGAVLPPANNYHICSVELALKGMLNASASAVNWRDR